MEVLEKPGRRRKQLLDDIKETWGCWKLKEDCIRSHCVRTRFGRVLDLL